MGASISNSMRARRDALEKNEAEPVRASKQTRNSRRGATQHFRRLGMLMVLAMFATAVPVLSPATAGAQTTTPPVPTPATGVLVFEEDFQSASPEQSITTFTGVAGSYTADPFWQNTSFCNGILLSRNNSAAFGGCASTQTNNLGLIAEALGGGDPDNVVVAGYTNGGNGTAADLIQVQTAPITVTDERFYYATVDVGAQNCNANSPEHQFFLESASGTQLILGNAVEVCDTSDGVSSITTQTMESPEAIRWDLGTSLSLGVNNLQPSGRGNDAAIDNLRLIDVTPQLHKSFSPAPIVNGQSANIVFTIVNTDELLAKNGISFTDDMVDLTVVDGVIGGTCSNVTGTAVGAQIDITNADIADDVASCTIEVEVVPNIGPGTYENGIDEVSGLSFIEGLDGDAFLEVLPAPPVVEDHESAGNAIGDDVEIDVLANATDLEGDIDPTSVAIVDPNYDPSTGTLVVPGEGTWTVDPDSGAITFSPEPGFEGDPAPISYTVMDDAGNTSEPGTITVDYVPTAVDDESLGNPVGSSVTVDVLANDGDIDPTTVAIDDPAYDPSAGTLVVAGEGTWSVDPVSGAISFVPEVGFVGDPTPISYTASDDDGNEVGADVTVTYAPVLEDDESLGNLPGTQVAVPLIGNDSDDVDPATIAFIDPATGLALNAGQNLVVAGEGTWMVNQTTGVAFFTPEPGFEGDPTPVDYQAADTSGVLGEPATITVDYIPTAEDDESLGNTPGDPVIVDVLANDGDIDPSTVMITDADGNPVTELVVAGEGTWTVDPATGAITFTPEAGFVGNPTPISYSATDDDGNEVGADVVVGYTPQAAPDESLGNTIGDAVIIDVLGNDPASNLDPTTVAIDDPAYDPSTGTLVVAGEGTWSVDPATGAITFTPEEGFEGDPTPISYTVADDLGQSTPPVEVTVDYVPGAVADESLGNTPGDPVIVDVLANDGDIDPTTVMITDADGNPVTELVVAGEGTWSVDPATGAITFTPEAGFVGNPTPISYTATDDDGNEVGADVVVGYTPQAAPDESLDNIPGTAVTIDVLGNDPASNLDPTTVAIDDPAYDPSTGTLVVAGEGTWSVDPATGAITFTPEEGFEGDPTPISYTVADDLGQTTPPVEVVVDYLPVPPAAADESLGNVSGSTVTIDVLANDGTIDPTTVMILDADGNEVTELVIAGEGTWTVDPTTGEITFTPETGFTGNPTPIEYIAADVLGVSIAPQTVTVTYLAPVASTPPVLAFTGVESWQLTLAALLLLGAGMSLTLLARREEAEVI